MSVPFLGEIRIFAGNFAPAGWAFCQGQLLAISENDALFALLGTTYGGDGQTTFALPDLAGRIAVHQGTGPGLSPRTLGENGGSESVTVSAQQMPLHTHAALSSSSGANKLSPAANFWSTDPGGNTAAYSNAAGSQMAATAVGSTGGGQPHDNVQPFLAINYIIALQGIFPSQS